MFDSNSVESKNQLLNDLNDVSNQLGCTIVVVTHSDGVAKYAKRIVKIIIGYIISGIGRLIVCACNWH